MCYRVYQAPLRVLSDDQYVYVGVSLPAMKVGWQELANRLNEAYNAQKNKWENTRAKLENLYSCFYSEIPLYRDQKFLKK